MKKLLLSALLLFLFSGLFAQDGKFKKQENFPDDVRFWMQRSSDSSANGLAESFTNTWESRLTPEQQKQVFDFSAKMFARGMSPDPHLKSMWACIDQGVRQGSIKDEQVSKFLEVAEATGDDLAYSTKMFPKFFYDVLRILRDRVFYRSHYSYLKPVGNFELTFGHARLDGEIAFASDTTGNVEIDTTPLIPHVEPVGDLGEVLSVPQAEGTEHDPDDDGWGSAADVNSGGWDDGWDTGNEDTGDDGWSSAEDVQEGMEWGNEGDEGVPDLPEKYADKYIVPQRYATHFYVHASRPSKDQRGSSKRKKVDYIRMIKPEMEDARFGEAAMPASGGPYIKFSKTTLELGSIHDTIRIKDTEGYFIPLRNGIVADGGRVDWPFKDKSGEIFCEFGKYFFDVTTPNLRVEGAKLTHTGKLEKPAEGIFEYKSVKDNHGKNPYYPRFASYYGDNRVKSPLKDVRIVGGLSLVGKRVSTRNLRRDKSRIEILKEGEIHVSASAREPFIFTDSTVSGRMAGFKVYFNRRDTLGGTLDSITHPGVSLLYSEKKGMIHARRYAEVYNTVPFMNSYHKIEMHVDKLRWDLAGDSLYAYVMSAANMVPAVVESQNFFHETRLRALQGINNKFHPLAAPVRFAQMLRKTSDNKGGVKEFSLKAMAEVLGLNPVTLRGASSEMTRLGYLNYDPFLDWISLTDKGLLYSNAPLRRQDFDRIRFFAFDSLQKNMVLSFESSDLVINGVDSILVRIPPRYSDNSSKFYFGPEAASELIGDLEKNEQDGGAGMGPATAAALVKKLKPLRGQHFRDSAQLKRAIIAAVGLDDAVTYMGMIFQVSRKDKMAVHLHPGNRKVVMKKNRNFTFDGKLTANTYANFYGKEFEFDYDSFAVKMVKIDSAALMITDTLTGQFKEMTNKIRETTGKFELSHFTNRSGVMPKNRLPKSIRDMKWPIFRLEGDAHVDFTDTNVLGGAYAADSTVRFDLRPFAKDDLGRKDNRADGGLDGDFRSGNIFPDFEEKLQVQRDGSFGFVHDIMNEAELQYREPGYPLYKDSLKSDRQTARFQGQITMNNQGIRSSGEIKYLTAKLNSNDFVYYPEKVTVYGPEAADGSPEFGGETVYSFGEIAAGVFEGTPYPDVKMDPFVMNWNVKQDEMLLSDTVNSFMMYHIATPPIRNDQSSTFNGTLSLNPLRLAGSGTIANLGSVATSEKFKFEQNRYEARNAEFVVLSEDVMKPGVKAQDVAVDYDMTTRKARLTSESDSGNISFPYTAYKTTIAEALWDFDKKEVDMTDEGRTTPSVFSSTRADQAGLEFGAHGAHYDLTDYTLNISGADSIFSVDSYIYPDKSEVIIRKNAEMDTLKNSRLTVNAYERYHKLKQGNIKISSRERFNGNAIYIYVNDGRDTFFINFDRFDVESKVDEATGENSLRTLAGSNIKEEDNFIKQIGVQYKGKVQMIADSISLIYDGFNKFTDSDNNPWIKNDPESEFIIITHREKDERKRDLGSGIFMSRKSGKLYTATRTPINGRDADVFKADGAYRRVPSVSRDVVEPQKRGTWFRESKGISPEITASTFRGNKFSYNREQQKAEFEGRFDLFEPESNFRLLAGGTGRADYGKAMYSFDLLTVLDFGEGKNGVFKTMSDDLERFRGGFKSAVNYNKLGQKMFYATADLLTEPEWLKFFEKAQRGRAKYGDTYPNSVTLSGVNLHWSEKHKAYFSTGKIGLINILKKELNIKTAGYLEVIPGDGKPEVNLYLKFVDQAWYMISYRDGKVFLLGSNFDFNTEVANPKAKHKFKILPDEDKNNFLSRFRRDYLGQGGSFDDDTDTIKDLDEDDGE